jgi:membrane protein DedA with SNARE-associated domain
MGAALWSVAVAAGGYFFGYAVQGFVHDIRKYEIHAMVIVCAAGIALWAVHKLRNRKSSGGNTG